VSAVILFVGRICGIREGAAGHGGQVVVRGARMEVALDLVPEARLGDSVLVHAGVALSVLRGVDDDKEEASSCA
jgi:hydrogenase maturation factor